VAKRGSARGRLAAWLAVLGWVASCGSGSSPEARPPLGPSAGTGGADSGAAGLAGAGASEAASGGGAGELGTGATGGVVAGEGGANGSTSGGTGAGGGVDTGATGGTGATGNGGEANSDSGRTGATGGTGPVTPPDGPGFTFESISLPGFSDTSDFAFIPGKDDELLVLNHSGEIHHLRLDGSELEAIGETKLAAVYKKQGCGLLSLAFDPEFEKNHYVYLGYCTSITESRLTRHVFDSVSTLGDSTTDILTVELDEEPTEYWHRWGSFGFEPDGETMWAFLGDHFFKSNGQSTDDKFGALLRFLPAREDDEEGMVPAPGNAFTDEADGDLSVFAYGLRSPWRGSRDRLGRFWIGDVGLVTFEEVNLVTEAGQNFGWSREEGPCEEDCDELVDPKAFWGRDGEDAYTEEDPDTEPEVRRAVWVGEAYESPSTDRYFGFHDDLVIFGDFYTGWVRGMRADENGEIVEDILLGHLPGVSQWRVGPDGYMYALTYKSGLKRALPRSD
jgi:hypothetical protein